MIAKKRGGTHVKKRVRMHVCRDDQVEVISGAHQGKSGKVYKHC